MAIRKITELPLVNPLDNSIRGRLINSYVEMSLADSDVMDQAYTFSSKKVKYSDLEHAIVQHISGTPTNPVAINFYTSADFHKPVKMLAGLKLSGDVYINDRVPEVVNYELSVNMGTILLNSTEYTEIKSNGSIQLSSSNNIGIYSNGINFYNENSSTPRIQFSQNKTTIKTATNIENTLTAKNIIIPSDGSITCYGGAKFHNIIDGIALKAKWADLAEMYDSDFEYEPGTLVKFGGEKEITIADDMANAVITTKPGLLLGENDTETKIPIALVGKVPVKVIGSVKKFDKLVLSDTHGIAKSKNENEEHKTVIGIALETIECGDGDINLINSVVQMKF